MSADDLQRCTPLHQAVSSASNILDGDCLTPTRNTSSCSIISRLDATSSASPSSTGSAIRRLLPHSSAMVTAFPCYYHFPLLLRFPVSRYLIGISIVTFLHRYGTRYPTLPRRSRTSSARLPQNPSPPVPATPRQ